MKKKSNKKFTTSKKGLVLSLACVSVLASVANANTSNSGLASDGKTVKGDAAVTISGDVSGSALDINGFSGGKFDITINSGVTIGSITDGVNPANGNAGKANSGGYSGTFLNKGTVTGGVEINNLIVSGGETAKFINEGSMGYLDIGKIGTNPTNSGANVIITNSGTINGDLSSRDVSAITSKKASGASITITNAGTIGGNIVLDKVSSIIADGSGDATFTLNNTANATIKGSLNIDELIVRNASGAGDHGKATADITNSGTINKGVNIKSITLENNGVSGSFVNVKNDGKIKGAITLGTIDVTTNSGSGVVSFINSGELGGFKLNGNITLKSGDDKSKGSSEFKFENTGTLGDFEISKGVSIDVTSGSATISNSGNITNWINNGTINAEGKSGAITISNSGNIDKVVNNGSILNSDGFSNAGNIDIFENAKVGQISKITNTDAKINTLNNAGKIITITNNNSSTINNVINTGSIGSGSNTSAGIKNDTNGTINTIANYGNIINGVVAGDSAAIYNLGSIGTIINSNKFSSPSLDGSGATSVTTNAKIGNIVSSGGSTSIGLIDNQNGTIEGIINRESSIATVQNTGTIKSIIVTGSTSSNANFGTISNLKNGVIESITLSGSATITSIVNDGIIGNKNAFGASSDAISIKSGGNSIASLVNTGSINGNIKLVDNKVGNNSITTLTNAGTITGTITLDGGLLGSDAITNIRTLDNLENAKIGGVKVGGTSGGLISTLNNYGEITNGITIAKGSGSIIDLNNYSALGNVDTGKVGLTNDNTIDNLRNYETGSIVYKGEGTINKLLENSGTIALAKGAEFINLANGTRVNNSGTVTGAQDGGKAILLASGGAAISINNTGFIDIKNYKQSQIGVDGENASVNVESWRLRLNESVNEFNNTPGYTYNVSKEGYVSGTFIPAEQTTPPAGDSGSDTDAETEVQTPKGSWIFTNITSGANTDTNRMNSNSHIYVSASNDGKVSNINFLDKSIVLDLSNQGFEIGQVYSMDNLVYSVDSSGQLEGIGSAEWTIKDNGSGNGTLVYELSSGAAVNAGKGLTVDNLTTLDDIFTINETFIDTITSANGDGKRVRGFSVGVDAANGAGAILSQGLTNVNARRSLFIDSITSTAIQATIDLTNRTQQVSYNDSEINFENLAKYAQISTDAYSATTNRDTYFYAMPYYTSDSMDLQGGFENLKGNTYGLVAGAQKNLYDAGIVGLFFGFESGSYDTSSGQTTYNQDDLTFYGGLNYYKVLGGTENREYYVRTMAKAALINSDISRTAGANGGSGDATAKSANFGVGADVGINFYLTDAHVISPEIGISYDRLNTESFTLGNQYYDESDVNLFQGKIGFNWLAQWSPIFSTNFGLGIKNNFTGDIDTAVVVANNRINQNVDLPSTYQYVQGGLSYMITNNVEVSLNYNGNYSSDTSSHSGLLRLGMWW